MPSVTIDLVHEGPIVQVALFVSSPRAAALKAAGQPQPKGVMVRLLVDTGASGTCIDPTYIQQLAIPPSGLIDLHTPSTGGTPLQCKQYDVNIAIVLDNGQYHFVNTLPVVESHLSSQGIGGLLGRDVLAQGLLFYNGVARTYTLSF